MEKELLTINQVCEATKLGRTYIYRLLKSGDLKGIKIGRRTMVRKNDIDAWASSLAAYPSINTNGGKDVG